ncbi:hypothetical protein HWV62_24414 [Athelia sp. TMB]|nr:hypothetical protein HWV62_24414 [Athelia sp. TMB]
MPLAMLICLAAECAATYSLAKYEGLQDHVEATVVPASSLLPGATHPQLHNDDIIAAEVIIIVFCVFVATLFGADFFFLLFFPRRIYPRWYNITRKLLAVGIALGVLAGALMSSVVVARNSAFITGVDERTRINLITLYYRPPLKYSLYSTNIAYVVLTWIGFLCTAASTLIMFQAAAHDAQHGADPKPDRHDASALANKDRTIIV